MEFLRKIISIPKAFFRWFRNLSWKKKIIVTIVLIIIFFIVLGQLAAISAPPGYTLAKVERSNITETVTETGSVAANGSVEVFSPTNGIVKELYVSNGTQVTEGQELMLIESTATEQEQSSAHANYLTAVATMNAAQSNLNLLRAEMYSEWDSFRDLSTNDTYENGDGSPNSQNREAAEFQIAQDQWVAAEKKYKDQQTVVNQAKSLVGSSWLLYQATQNAVVKATTNGKVHNLSITTGSTVNIQTPTVSKPILTIANLNTTEVVVALSESDIAKVKDGQRVEIDISAIDDKKYNGTVRRVDTIGSDTLGVMRYNAYIEITNPDDKIRSGMTADVEIVTDEIANALSVPNSAVKPYQGGRGVRTVNPTSKQIDYIPVEIGIRGEERTQILKGLTEGQEVVTALSNEQIKRPGLF